MNNITAIIPARGGSKTLPAKNIKEFAGKLLIIHSIEYALESKFVDEVVVSTDDSKISKISRDAGAAIIKRPDEFGGVGMGEELEPTSDWDFVASSLLELAELVRKRV